MTSYEQGFIDKCAEFGVDGETLLKDAQTQYQGKPVTGNTVLQRMVNARKLGWKPRIPAKTPKPTYEQTVAQGSDVASAIPKGSSQGQLKTMRSNVAASNKQPGIGVAALSNLVPSILSYGSK